VFSFFMCSYNVMVPYICPVFNMWLECPELPLLFFIIDRTSGMLCLFVLCILVGSLGILFRRCHFCHICLFMNVVLLCFLLYSVFWMLFLYVYAWIVLWFFLFLFRSMWKWVVLFFGVVRRCLYSVFVRQDVLFLYYNYYYVMWFYNV
jgi:hypothetical protein